MRYDAISCDGFWSRSIRAKGCNGCEGWMWHRARPFGRGQSEYRDRVVIQNGGGIQPFPSTAFWWRSMSAKGCRSSIFDGVLSRVLQRPFGQATALLQRSCGCFSSTVGREKRCLTTFRLRAKAHRSKKVHFYNARFFQEYFACRSSVLAPSERDRER